MCDLKLKATWSLNDAAVPLVEATVDIEDPFNLSESHEEVELLLLNLKCTEGAWIDKALLLSRRSWLASGGRLAFNHEIRNAILSAKAADKYMLSEKFLFIKIRNKILKVKADMRAVILAFEKRCGAGYHLVLFRDPEGHQHPNQQRGHRGPGCNNLKEFR